MVIDPVVTNLGAVPLTHPVVSETSLGWSMTPRGRSMQYPEWQQEELDDKIYVILYKSDLFSAFTG